MIYSNNFVLKFVLLVQILNHLFALSDAETLRTSKNSTGMAVHAKPGTYPWADKERTCGLVIGQSANPRLKGTPKIVNGTEADIQEFPWMVSVVITYWPPPGDYPRPYAGCGGVIISDYFVLTASWCVPDNWTSFMSLHAYVGSKYKYETYKVKYEAQQKNSVEYEPLSGKTKYPTLALVRVKHRIPSVFYDNKYRVNRVCLPQENVINNKTEDALVSGFGRTGVTGAGQSFTLKKANYKIDSVDDCQTTMNMTSDYICSLVSDQTCIGDWGSPLVQFVGDRAVLIGIVADFYPRDINTSRCGPGETLFIRVSPFIGWIKNIISRDDGQDWATQPPYTRPPAAPPAAPPVTTKKPEVGDGGVDQPSDKDHSGVCHLLADKTVSLIIVMFLFRNILF